MPRKPRLVVPNYPHHVTQRGNRRQPTFFCDEDYRSYLKLLAAAKSKAGVHVWAYCLMPNHVHLVVVPEREDSLARFFQESHRQYTRRINARYDWQGHLWQERFHSCVMDESYLVAAVRYVELNPVRAGLCVGPLDWPWSSARAHLSGSNDALVKVGPMRGRIGDWSAYLCESESEAVQDRIRSHSRTGQPAGSDQFIEALEQKLGRDLRRRRPGPQRRSANCER